MDFKKIDQKWQKRWEDAKIFEVKVSKKKKYYVLEMFPYTSGKGIHMGHLRNYSIGDCFARFKRMQGFNVLYPMGYDAFGLPAENAAIKHKIHPKEWTEKSIKNIEKQQRMLGLSYDWSRKFTTYDPKYYKWNQWIFLQMFKRGLAYKKKAPVNWCPSCNTVLANEQVVQGECWRCSSKVEIKSLEQWFFKITEYVEELLKDLDLLGGWPERVKSMQKNWIGKSEGVLIDFKLKDSNESLPVFTTRSDTLFGVTFMVFAPENPKVLELVKGTKYESDVKKFINRVVIEDKFTRTSEDKEKEGMFIGRYVVNPANREDIPIYIANFVLMDYGTGFIMGVPAHDQRDLEFAKKYDLPIKIVIKPKDSDLSDDNIQAAYVDEGILVNSGQFDGMKNNKAADAITKWLIEKGTAKQSVEYKLRDWLISRQRYWGTPIPIVYCDKCGIVPVQESKLPVELPTDVEFTGKGNPIATSKTFVNTKCPKCRSKAKRETDTMDTFVDSSWYFFRFCDPKNSKKPFDKKKVEQWMPIDQYIGGIEHAVMHLLYSRFITRVLRDMGMHKTDEPFTKLLNQGLVMLGGTKMSKSKGNVVDPIPVVKKYGADTARFFMLSASNPEHEIEWSDEGINGSYKFLNRVYNLVKDSKKVKGKKTAKDSRDNFMISRLNQTIKTVTESIEKLEINVGLRSIMQFVSDIEDYTMTNPNPKVLNECIEKLVIVLSPYTPHICEEMWEAIGNKQFVSLESWSKANEKLIDKKIIELENIFRKTIGDLRHVTKLAKKVDNAYIYITTDKELDYFKQSINILKKKFDFSKIELLKSSDKKIYDPQQKAQKAKYGKPGIYLE